jgi:hypothetical protein
MIALYPKRHSRPGVGRIMARHRNVYLYPPVVFLLVHLSDSWTSWVGDFAKTFLALLLIPPAIVIGHIGVLSRRSVLPEIEYPQSDSPNLRRIALDRFSEVSTAVNGER